jgi:hypothetical protein
MTESWEEMLSRFVDGESVDADGLADALASPEGRDALVDYARLRTNVRAVPVEPSAAFYTAWRREWAEQPRRAGRWLSYRVAAVLIAAAALAGYGVDVWRRRPADRPPRVERVLRFEPGEWRVDQGGKQ